MRDLKVQNILKQLDEDLVPDPYLSQKVWAEVSSKNSITKSYRREIFFWRGLSLASLGFLAVLLIRQHQPESVTSSAIPVHNPIVFHLENDSGIAYENVRMEMELPEGVEFHTNDARIAKKRTLSLSADRFEIGKSRLPFVVEAKSAGLKQFKIHVFDENDKLIKEKILTIQFSEPQKAAFNQEKII
ncbi:MAG TPA: hypothetical protein VIG33_00815 [Pseudobdellovibrionaceae bacterium]|jgi:hypothetical protein